MDHATETAHAASQSFIDWGDPATWAGVGLLLFVALLLWQKIPGAMAKSLDARAAKISSELANAEALRKEAEAKLKDAEKRQADAEAQATQIVEAARKEAALFAENASRALAETVSRRQKTAEERIARAEAEAIRDVKLAAVDTASRAAASVLAQQLTAKGADDHFAQSLEAVKKALS